MSPTLPIPHPVRICRLGRLVWLGLLAALLTACGGSDPGDSNFGTPTVTDVTVDRVSRGQLSTFTVTGTHLTASVDFGAGGCDGMTVLRDSTTRQRVTCTPTAAQSVRFTAAAAGTTLWDRTYTGGTP